MYLFLSLHSRIILLFAKLGNNHLTLRNSQDDIIDDPHSFLDAARHLKLCEAAKIYIIATHGILSGDALKCIEDEDAITAVIVTNTYPLRHTSRKLKVIDISGVIAEAIRRTHNGESISYLFHTAI